MTFRQHTGLAAPLLLNNVNTDAIIPSTEMVSIDMTDLSDRLFANWRYLAPAAERRENPDFVLNQDPYRQATILLAGDNFGCGSSREAAAWALQQFGIRCVLATSLASIFHGNCVRNGILAIEIGRENVEALSKEIEAGETAFWTVDLEACQVRTQSTVLSFTMDATDRRMLLTGLDVIELTLQHDDQIKEFSLADQRLRPWIYLPERTRPTATAGAQREVSGSVATPS